MYVFGGYNEGNCHNDIYAFDLLRHHWYRIETSNGISPGKKKNTTGTSMPLLLPLESESY